MQGSVWSFGGLDYFYWSPSINNLCKHCICVIMQRWMTVCYFRWSKWDFVFCWKRFVQSIMELWVLYFSHSCIIFPTLTLHMLTSFWEVFVKVGGLMKSWNYHRSLNTRGCVLEKIVREISRRNRNVDFFHGCDHVLLLHTCSFIPFSLPSPHLLCFSW